MTKRLIPVLLFLALAGPALIFSSCALLKKKTTTKRGFPRNIAVLPVSNQSQDLSAPILVRYFLEKEIKRKKFVVAQESDEIDRQLRQMGVTDGNQIYESNIQSIGQFLKVDGLLQSTVLESRIEKGGKKIIRARFQLVSTQTGQKLWEKVAEADGSGAKTIPKGMVSADMTRQMVRTIAKSPAGHLPGKVVREALKSLRP